MEGNAIQMTNGVTINASPATVHPETGPMVAKSNFENTSAGIDQLHDDAEPETADMILESARMEGFEATLVGLSEGRFDAEEEQGSEQDVDSEFFDVVEDKDSEIEGAEVIDGNNTDLEVENVLTAPERLEQLKEQFAALSEEMVDVKSRLGEIEQKEMASKALAEALLMFMQLNNAENEEEQISIFELLVKAMARILLEIAPGGDEVLQKQEGATAQKPKARQKKILNINEARKSLEERGIIRRPVVENQAA